MKKSGKETIMENVFDSFDMPNPLRQSGQSRNDPEMLYKEYQKQAA